MEWDRLELPTAILALSELLTGLALCHASLCNSSQAALQVVSEILVSILLSACVWLLLGFSLCFGATLGPTDDPGSLLGFQNWQEKDWHQALYYAVFALVAPQLAKGTVVPQLPMLRCCFFTLTWVTAVFVPLCHTVWGGGWLAQWGVEDFAGGSIIHIPAGASLLAALLTLRPRAEEDAASFSRLVRGSCSFAVGYAALSLGWFGLTCAPALAVKEDLVRIAENGLIAGFSSFFGWLLLDLLRHGQSGPGLPFSAVAGLVAIASSPQRLRPWAAGLLGTVVAACANTALALLSRNLPASLSLCLASVHGVAGLLGMVLLPTLSDPCHDIRDCTSPRLVDPSPQFILKQAVAAHSCALYSFVMTWILLKVTSACLPMASPTTADVKTPDLEAVELPS